jgi:hypothetical protein
MRRASLSAIGEANEIGTFDHRPDFRSESSSCEGWPSICPCAFGGSSEGVRNGTTTAGEDLEDLEDLEALRIGGGSLLIDIGRELVARCLYSFLLLAKNRKYLLIFSDFRKSLVPTLLPCRGRATRPRLRRRTASLAPPIFTSRSPAAALVSCSQRPGEIRIYGDEISRCASTASFFNGWRSTPGTIPATSQLDWPRGEELHSWFYSTRTFDRWSGKTAGLTIASPAPRWKASVPSCSASICSARSGPTFD